MKDQILFAPAIKSLNREERFILIDPFAPNWIATNQVGYDLVRQIDGRKNIEELISSFVIGDGRNDLKNNCRYFIKELINEDFIQIQPHMKPPYPGRAKAIEPKGLSEVWIYTNDNCNLSCRHCLVSENRNSKKKLSYSSLINLINQTIDLGAQRFFFTGGEPFLREDIFDLINYVTKRAELVILTNGSLLDEETITRLKKFKDKIILQISLEGSNSRINDQVRGKGSFKKTISIINKLVEAGISPIVTTTITMLNLKDLPNITILLNSVGVKTHHILWLHLRGQGQRNYEQLFVDGGKIAQAMIDLFNLTRGLEIEVDNETWLRSRLVSKKRRKSDLCNSCWEMLSISSEGDVYPCPSLSGDDAFNCGKVNGSSIADIWLKSDKANWIRENTVEKKVGCNDCYLKFLCGGGCYCQAFYAYKLKTGYGCIMAPDPYCEAYRKISEEILFSVCREENRALPDKKPVLLASMTKESTSCAHSSTKVINGAFEVNTFHCSCVMKN